MPSAMLQFLISMGITAVFFVLTWFVTRFYKPESLEIKFAAQSGWEKKKGGS